MHPKDAHTIFSADSGGVQGLGSRIYVRVGRRLLAVWWQQGRPYRVCLWPTLDLVILFLRSALRSDALQRIIGAAWILVNACDLANRVAIFDRNKLLFRGSHYCGL